MSICGCNCRNRCVLLAIGVSILAGILGAFLQITGTFTVTPVYLIVAFGIAVAALGVLVVSMALLRRCVGDCLCAGLNAVLAGIVGTVLFSVIGLLVGIVATGAASAVLVGLVAGFFALTVTSGACLVRCLADCAS